MAAQAHAVTLYDSMGFALLSQSFAYTVKRDTPAGYEASLARSAMPIS
jgi:hypothetical protein